MANCQAVILSVDDDTGHRIIIEDLLEATRSPEVGMRQAAAAILNMYCSRSKADYTSHLRSLVSGLIRLFNDSSPVVLEESWDALNAITKKLDAGNQLALIEELHKEIRFIGNECKGEHVPGFCLPKRVSRACSPCRGTSQCAALWWPSAHQVHHALGLSSEAVSARASEWAQGGSCANPLSSACWVPCPQVRSHSLGSGSGLAEL